MTPFTWGLAIGAAVGIVIGQLSRRGEVMFLHQCIDRWHNAAMDYLYLLKQAQEGGSNG